MPPLGAVSCSVGEVGVISVSWRESGRLQINLAHRALRRDEIKPPPLTHTHSVVATPWSANLRRDFGNVSREFRPQTERKPGLTGRTSRFREPTSGFSISPAARTAGVTGEVSCSWSKRTHERSHARRDYRRSHRVREGAESLYRASHPLT